MKLDSAFIEVEAKFVLKGNKEEKEETIKLFEESLVVNEEISLGPSIIYNIEDSYYDTGGFDLSKKGLRLRLRNSNGNHLVTLKEKIENVKKVKKRYEWEDVLTEEYLKKIICYINSKGILIPKANITIEGFKKGNGIYSLDCILKVKTTRNQRNIIIDEKVVAILCIDKVTYESVDNSVFFDIEVEKITADENLFNQILADIVQFSNENIKICNFSKFKRGIKLLRGEDNEQNF